jgi:hypothetical protein
LVFASSYAQQKKSFRYNLIFDWKLFEWIRDRFERTIGDFASWMKPPIKAEAFINSPGRFFHYAPLFNEFYPPLARSFSKK